jgi:hypothetical protein
VTIVVLACRELMVASRLELAAGVEVRRAGDDAAVRERLAQALEEAGPQDDGVAVVVDLVGFPELPRTIRSWHDLGGAGAVPVVAFAPHVREDLLDAAREHADVVAARGAVVKDLARQVGRAIEVRRNAAPDRGR